jgi:hypothetical protein
MTLVFFAVLPACFANPSFSNIVITAIVFAVAAFGFYQFFIKLKGPKNVQLGIDGKPLPQQLLPQPRTVQPAPPAPVESMPIVE